MTYIVSSGALNSTHSLTRLGLREIRSTKRRQWNAGERFSFRFYRGNAVSLAQVAWWVDLRARL